MNIETIVAAQGLQAFVPPAAAGSTVQIVFPPGASQIAFGSVGGVSNFQGNADGSLTVVLDGTPGNATVSWFPQGGVQGQGFNPQMTLVIPGSTAQKLTPVGEGGNVKIPGPSEPIHGTTSTVGVGLSTAAKVAIGAGVVAAGVGGVAVAGAINEGNAGHYFGIAAESAVGAVMEARRRARKL